VRFVSVLFIPFLLSASAEWIAHRASLPGEAVAGALFVSGGRVVTWGDKLRVWDPARMTSTAIAAGPFAEGACAFGEQVVAVRGRGLGDLLAIRLTDGHSETIDSQVGMRDCVEATLFGRRGVLMIQRGMQVRFYEQTTRGKWISRDIYSIYTPSYQSGLAIADVDERFEESWRLFVINTWFEEPESASLRIVALGRGRLAAAQARMSPARFARFEAPRDPEMPWTATPLVPR
jgi:hypothetical protein